MPSVPSQTPSFDNLPHGSDRADGLSGRLGTPTPTNAITYESGLGVGYNSIPIQELSSSPTMERAEQCTIRKSFTGSYPEMLNRWAVYPRGTLVVDSGNNYYRVLNTTLTRLAGKGEVGQLDLVCEALSFDSPPDEFQINTVNLGLDIMKNPRYFYALMPTNQIPHPLPSYIVEDTPVQNAVKSTIIRAIQAYKENPLVPPQDVLNNTSGFYHDLILNNLVTGHQVYAVANPNFNSLLNATAAPAIGSDFSGLPYPPAATIQGQPNPPIYYTYFSLTLSSDPNGKVALAMAAAQELLTKIWRMEDSPPVYGLELVWAEYYWRPITVNLGSYIENPIEATPGLPDFFYCPQRIPDGSTIFDNIGQINPQYYSVTGQRGGGTKISWLRQADTLEFNRTFFKVTRKWLGAPVGCWDADLFNQNGRPRFASDYNRVILS
jgi:hypothetical protein